MPVNLDSFTGPGSTPSRRRFWDKVTQAVNASQKIEGKNISCDEHEGYGTLISTNPQRGGTGGACCDEEGNCTISTEAECDGTFQGVGTVCDPNPCGATTGACCIEGVCSILSESDCTDGGGNYLGNGSTCSGIDCTISAYCDGNSCNEVGVGTFLGFGTRCCGIELGTAGKCCQSGSAEGSECCDHGEEGFSCCTGGHCCGSGVNVACCSPAETCCPEFEGAFNCCNETLGQSCCGGGCCPDGTVCVDNSSCEPAGAFESTFFQNN